MSAARKAALVSGCASLCAAWTLSQTDLGVIALLVGASLVILAAIVGAIAERSVGGLVMPLAAGILVFLSFPLVVNLVFWVGRGFRGP